jgi:hypothetical protein
MVADIDGHLDVDVDVAQVVEGKMQCAQSVETLHRPQP